MPDKSTLIKTATQRFPVLEFGDGVTAGEVWDSKTYVEDGIIKETLIIKMTEELRARFGHLMAEEDLREGFTEWKEIQDLLIPITRNPSAPRIFALRSFDHQPTPFSLINNVLINSMKRLSNENGELRKALHAEQENFRKFTEGTAYVKMEEIFRRVIGEEFAKFFAMLQTRKG